MSTTYKLSYTGQEIDNRLGLVGNAILFTEQSLTEEQKIQAKLNLGISSDEEKEEEIITNVEYTYDGNDSGRVQIIGGSGAKTFVKVADIPNGEIDLINGIVNATAPTNAWNNYDFIITDEMLNSTVNQSGVNITAQVNGCTQIFYQDQKTDSSPITTVIICTKAGYYDIAFDTWMETLQIPEKGIYFMDNRAYGGNKYISSLSCKIITTSGGEKEETQDNPSEYRGNEIQVFTRGLCIGDSITEGVFNHAEGETIVKKYSYPSILKRLTNIEIVNAGISGLTSKTWYEASLDSNTQYGKWVDNEWSWSTNPTVEGNIPVSTTLDYSGFDFAIIHLGINDIGMMGSTALNTVVTTFETNINNIINKLKAFNAGIKIFLATIIPCYAVPGNTAYEAINTKIREIANNTSDVFLIDLNTYSECFDETPYENSHLTAIGYRKMAEEIKSLISYTIKNNLADFKNIQFIGTNYSI